MVKKTAKPTRVSKSKPAPKTNSKIKQSKGRTAKPSLKTTITLSASKKLSILLVSDEHEAWDQLDKLVAFAKARGSKYDVVLMSGDQANCNNRFDAIPDPAENKAAILSMERYVKTLEEPGHKMCYLPGNHDADVFFASSPPKLGKHAINLHLQNAQICPCLAIVGMGGSKYTLLQKTGETEWVSIYRPYPFSDDSNYSACLNKAWCGIANS